jgi:hypothetical protein
LFVVVQPETDEGVGGDRTDEGVEVGGDGIWVETSARGAFAAETTGEDPEADMNISTKALSTDVAVAPEVWMLKGRFILWWVIFVGFKTMY